MQTERQRKIENLKKIAQIQKEQMEDTQRILDKFAAEEASTFNRQAIGRIFRKRNHDINIVYITAKDV